MFTKRPRFARLAAGIGRAAFIVAVCAGLLAMLVMAVLTIAKGQQ